MVCSLESEKNGSSGEPCTQLPATVAKRTPTAPMADASTTRPLRNLYIQKLTKSAIGIVQAMVKVPHELPGSTWTLPDARRKSWPPGDSLTVVTAGASPTAII